MSTTMPPMDPAPGQTTPRTQPDPAVPAQTASPAQPERTSIFILFEGPWIIYQLGLGVLRAVTFKNLPKGSMGAKHICQVGFGHSSGNLDSPIGLKQPTLTLNGGERWFITAPTPMLSQLNELADICDVPFNKTQDNDTFVYLRRQSNNITVNPQSHDRIVTLPTPDNVYFAGYLNSGKVSDPGGVLALDPNGKKDPRPHVTVIFEYTQQSATTLTLSLGGAAIVPIKQGKHLIFRMLHLEDVCDQDEDEMDEPMSPAEDADHIQNAFAALWSRFVPNDPKVSLTLSGVENTDTSTGKHTAGFGRSELGLKPPKELLSDTPDDCGGGGIVLS